MKSDLSRIFRSGFLNFTRNSLLSFASIFMMVITLAMISGSLFFHALSGYMIQQVKNRVDINVYFYPSASESQILNLKGTLEKLPEVAKIDYVSRDQALQSFREKHQNDALTLAALAELGTNPLGASLNIRAKDPTQYEQIANYLSSDTTLDSSQASIIEKVNYYQNAEIIDRMTAVTHSIDTAVRIIMGIFIVLSIIVIYNTIRLAIYASREEIHVMRLVGAQKRYVHGPFMVEGLLTGVFGAIITAILWYPITLIITKKMTTFFQGFSFLKYYGENFIQIFIIMLAVGIIIGTISAALCVNKFINQGQE